MPRRVPDYPDAFAPWNLVSSIGAYIAIAGTVLFMYIAIRTLFAGKPVEANYWGEGATTLEWSLSSPPPFHQHLVLPDVK